MADEKGKINRCVILAGGDIVDYPAAARRLRPDDFVLCADSGYRHCEKLGAAPGLLVGDFDSIEALPPGIPRRAFNAEKDYTDTTLAIETAWERGFRELLLMGMLGGRLDHTLANLQSLADLSARGAAVSLTDGRTDILAVTDGRLTMPPRKGYYFSLLSVTGECAGVSIRGARYLLDRHHLLPTVPRAISNEFLDGPVEITVERGTLLIIQTPMDSQGLRP